MSLKINSFQLKKSKGSESVMEANENKLKHFMSNTNKGKIHTSTSKDYSPSRNKNKYIFDSGISKQSTKYKIKDEHFSRKNEDLSPPRNKKKDYSPKEKTSEDFSPLRKKTDDLSPPSKKFEDLSPVRRRDLSPPRKKRKEDKSSVEKNRYDHIARKIKKEKSESPPRRYDVDSSHRGKVKDDFSRKIKQEKSESPRRKPDRDLSPPRRSQIKELSPSRRHKNRDLSPPRRGIKREQSESPPRQRTSRWSNKSPESSKKRSNPEKAQKTLSGKKAGLQNARDLVQEMIALREREEEMFKNMSEEVSGKNAATVVRGQQTKDPEVEAEILKKQNEIKEKYDRWGKGLKQVQNESEKMLEQLHEMKKPLARYADDEDLERYLKEQEREGDPMLAYIRNKKKKKDVEAGIPGMLHFIDFLY